MHQRDVNSPSHPETTPSSTHPKPAPPNAQIGKSEPEADPTPLARFMRLRKIKTGRLAHESGYCRQHILRISTGRMEPTRPCIVAIVRACRALTGARVRAGDLFNLEAEQESEN
jgi:hypothetical protein